MNVSPPRPRGRDLGLPFPGEPGPLNAITDVPGVEVGFCTLTDPAACFPGCLGTPLADVTARDGRLTVMLRADAAARRLTIDSAPGRGTRLACVHNQHNAQAKA